MSQPIDEPTDAPVPEYGAAEASAREYVVPAAGAPEYGAPVPESTIAPAVRSDPLRGILAGLGAAVVGAVVWTLVGYVTGYEIGIAATFLGLFVGFAVHKVGGQASTATAVAAAAIAVVGSIIAFLMLDIAIFAKDEGLSFFDAYTFVGTTIGWPEALKSTLGVAIRWLFLALAGWGAFRIVTQQALRGGSR